MVKENNHTFANVADLEASSDSLAAGVSFNGKDACSISWVRQTTKRLDWATRKSPQLLPHVLAPDTVIAILSAATALLHEEPTLMEVHPPEHARVTIVGDLHGAFHDFCEMLAKAGEPSPDSWFIFNGDYVDRGIWSIELLTILAAWKLTLSDNVFLLRGDHESSSCSAFYGLKMELKEKYGSEYKRVYRACKLLFKELPLMARIQNTTLVLHGGLWRNPFDVKPDDHPEMTRLLEIGDLNDVRYSGKGGLDPVCSGTSLLASDVLWSDPTHLPGMRTNTARGSGVLFGPDVTEQFLRDNGLKLIIRSHESPDSRKERLEAGTVQLPGQKNGFSIDHDTPAGRLCTVFSAPQYPFFTDNNNGASVLRLTGPTWSDPQPISYQSVERPTDRSHPFLPRNESETYDSDNDMYDKQEVENLQLYRESLVRKSRDVNNSFNNIRTTSLGSRKSGEGLSARASILADIAQGNLYEAPDKPPLTASMNKSSSLGKTDSMSGGKPEVVVNAQRGSGGCFCC